jgi:cyclin H
MTYHPKEIMRTALFLSTKTENSYISLDDFTAKFPKATREDVLAPEFLLCQGLRFTFDVRHPYRGLEGGYMELLALATGKGVAGPHSTASSTQIEQQEMKHLEPAKGGGKAAISAEDVVKRIENAKGKANEVLKTSALLTDAYLLYTPSQIWLSALYLVDKPLTRFYIDTKFPTPSELKPKLLNTLRVCADLLRSSPSADPGEVEMNELKKIDKKLYKCRNPEKTDLVGMNRAQKREGAEDGFDAKVIKKRKLEREKSEKEAEDIFGSALAFKK